jgi:hypothetical protein
MRTRDKSATDETLPGVVQQADLGLEPTEQPPIEEETRGNGAGNGSGNGHLPPGDLSAPPEPERKSDVFDHIEDMRIDPRRDLIVTKTVLLHCAARRPRPTEWIRAHPTLEMTVYGIEDRENGDNYIVMPIPGLLQLLDAIVRPKKLVPCINRQGTLFVWPVKLPKAKSNPWIDTEQLCLDAARAGWVRVQSNRDSGGYEIAQPIDPIPPPVWPEGKEMPDYLRLAYGRHKVIADASHAYVMEYIARSA